MLGDPRLLFGAASLQYEAFGFWKLLVEIRAQGEEAVLYANEVCSDQIGERASGGLSVGILYFVRIIQRKGF